MLFSYQCQLVLYAQMCLDRNQQAINHLAPKYSFDTLYMCIKDKYLPKDLQANFCELFIRIHVDTKPQEAVAAIDLARLWRDVQPALQLTIPEYRRPAIEEVGTHRAATSAQLHAPI